MGMGSSSSKKHKDDQRYKGEDMFLYWISGSPACFRVMIAFEEKKLTGYQQKHLDFLAREHKSDELLKLNPRGQVPTFTHKGHVLNESMGICEYLEYMYPQKGSSLVGQDVDSYRLMLQRKYELPNLQKKCEDIVYHLRSLAAAGTPVDPEDFKRREEAMAEELKLWDSYLAKVGDNCYLAGRYNFTLADLAFFPYLAFSVHFGLKLDDRFPHLASYYARAMARESVKRAWPVYWNMTPESEELYFKNV